MLKKYSPMKNLIKILGTYAFVILPAITFTHPGHGHDNPLSPEHYLGNPVHAIPVALTVAAAGFLIVWKIWKTRNETKK